MKWMLSTTLAVAVSAIASAQSDKMKSDTMKDDKMAMAMTYTGCIESVNHGAEFLLTHVMDGHEAMTHDGMMANALALTGRSDLKKHVGQKVTVKGSVSHPMAGAMANAHDQLTVSSMKVVAKSCS